MERTDVKTYKSGKKKNIKTNFYPRKNSLEKKNYSII